MEAQQRTVCSLYLHNLQDESHLVQVGYVFVQVIEAHDKGEGGHKDEEHVSDAAHPGPVPHPILRRIDCPGRQPALIQLQQPFIFLKRDNAVVSEESDEAHYFVLCFLPPVIQALSLLVACV